MKCVGEASQPCRNCLAAGLGCTYNAIPQKKGPKGSRAKIISELRESQQRQPQQIQLESTVAPRVSAIASARHERENVRSRSKDSAGRANVSTQSVLRSTPGSGRATVSASASPVQNLGHALNVGPSTAASGGVKGRPFRFYQLPSVASFDYVRSCVDFFFLEVYPNQPILGREETNELCAKMEESAEKHCLVIALCAYVTLLPNMAISTEGPLEAGRKVYRATVLLDELLQVRKGYAYMQSSSTWTVITSYFLFACYSRMENNSLAWFYLREATTIALMLGMHDEQAYQTADIQSNIRRRRLYWLLFVSERYAVPLLYT